MLESASTSGDCLFPAENSLCLSRCAGNAAAVTRARRTRKPTWPSRVRAQGRRFASAPGACGPDRASVDRYGRIDAASLAAALPSPAPSRPDPPPVSPAHVSQSGRARSSSKDWWGPACALLGAFGFSGKAIFAKLAYAAAPTDAVTILALRMLFSMPLFAIMLWWSARGSNAAPLARRDWLALLWLGFIGYYLASFLDFWGLEYISAGLERLILFLNPTIVVLLSAWFLKRPITRRTALALALTYAGILIAFGHDLVFTRDRAAIVAGSGLVLASAVAYAIYLVGNGGVIARIGAARFTAYGMLVSAFFVLLQFVLTRPLAALRVPASVHLIVAAMALFSTALPIWMTNEGIRRIGAGRVAMIGTSGPILTIGMSAVILDEPVTIYQMCGAVLVIAGVALVTFMKKRDTQR
jgi:drug/metabolite transporter (DMT)-like permease